jgi:hypothetical protein
MIPSSLVIRMTGKALFFDLDIVIKGLRKYYFFPSLTWLRYLCGRLKIPIWQDN